MTPLLLFALAGCNGSDLLSGPGVVVILVDTLRADRMSLYGNERETTPNLDAWSGDAMVFERHVVPSGWTLPSVASLLTGLLPDTHGCCQKIDAPGQQPEFEALSPLIQVLPERLENVGYTNWMLSRSNAIQDDRGFAQGFVSLERVGSDLASGNASGKSAGILTDRVLEWLADPPGGPWMLWIHYMDPHSPYEAPAGWAGTFSAGIDSEIDGSQETISALMSGSRSWTDADAEKMLALYDEEIAYLDTELARLFDALSDDTTIVLIGDHGEQFAEHDGWAHQDVWQENIHTPLIMAGPAIPPGRTDALVQTVDVSATLLSLLGLAIPNTWQGRDLTPLFAGQTIASTNVLSIFGTNRALQTPEGLKLILNTEGPTRLFDLSVDPDETSSLSRDQPEDVQALSAEIDAIGAECQAIAESLGI